MIYMLFLPLIIIGALVIGTAVSIVRSRKSSWKWLFALEALCLWLCVGNCFAPHPTKQFFQLEIPLVIMSIGLAVASSLLQARAKRELGIQSRFKIFRTSPMYMLYVVLFIVSLIVMMFLSTMP